MHNYAISQVTNQRIEYPDHTTQDFLDLNEYLSLAKYCIRKFVMHNELRYNMLNSEDAISHVAHAMMMGDWRYIEEPDKGRARLFNSFWDEGIRSITSTQELFVVREIAIAEKA